MNNEMDFKKILYAKLNARQKENYNFQKVSAVLADYGFNTLRLSDDWMGADFIAVHIDGKTFVRVQLKARLTFDKKYIGNNIWVAFPYEKNWFLYPHDELFDELSMTLNFHRTTSWKSKGIYTFNRLSKKIEEVLQKYKL